MMVALKEWQYNLLKKLEKENCSNYEIREIKGDFYIMIDDLIDALDETQNYRCYAEEKLSEVATDYDKKYYEENCNSLQLNTIKALNELRIENDNLKKENETLRREVENVCNEDMLDRLNMEGVEL